MAKKKPVVQEITVKEYADKLLGEALALSKEALIGLLWKYGFLAYKRLEDALGLAPPSEVMASVMAYQGFHGLTVDGWAGPQTARSMNEPRFCGHADVMHAQLDINRWPDKNIRYWVDPANTSGLSIDLSTINAALDWAWAQWAAVCNIQPERVDSKAKAHVVMTFAVIDQPGKVLAWSELADNTARQKTQRYDTKESWVNSATPARATIDLGRVSCHEIGHVLGIPHIANGNLLQPLYDVNIRGPQRGDIAEAQSRYGPPEGATPPPTNPGDRFVVTLEGVGQLNALAATGFKVERIA